MALVDFYQLATLHKLSQVDPEFPSTHSRRFCMSGPPPPLSPSPSAEPNEARPFLPSSMKSQPKTPEHDPRWSSVRQRQEGDTDRVDGYDCDDYEEYVREDLKSRVFVDFEVFMECVLHVPKDWNTRWESVIKTIKADPTFCGNLEGHRKYCNNRASLEVSFYEPLVGVANAIYDVLSRSECGGIDGIDSGIPQTTKPSNLHWANALQVLEVKPHGNAICDGEGMPKLVVDGERVTISSCIPL